MPTDCVPVAAASAFLEIRNLVKDFDGVRAVDNVSLTIDKGEIFALLGSSGCGKSTLLRMLAGFETQASGQVFLNGQDLAGVPPYRRPVNMMFQSYALFPHLSVWDNVAFGLRREGMARDLIAARVEQMLELVQLTSHGKRKPHQLSGGQQQRVALARCLSKRPQLLLLDEPLAALDKQLRAQMQTELVNIIEQVGVTCVLVTHDQEEAMSMASRVAVMRAGRILQTGRPDEIYETPNCRAVADFIGSINLFSGVVREAGAERLLVESPQCLHSLGRAIDAEPGAAVSIGIRPEKIAIDFDAAPEAGAHASNCAWGEMIEQAYFGSHTAYQLKLAGGMLLKASVANRVRNANRRAPKAGDRVLATWTEDAAVVVPE